MLSVLPIAAQVNMDHEAVVELIEQVLAHRVDTLQDLARNLASVAPKPTLGTGDLDRLIRETLRVLTRKEMGLVSFGHSNVIKGIEKAVSPLEPIGEH